MCRGRLDNFFHIFFSLGQIYGWFFVTLYCSTQALAQALGQGQAEPEMALYSLVPGGAGAGAGAGGRPLFQEMLNSSSAPEMG